MNSFSKLVLALVLALSLAGGVLYFFRDTPGTPIATAEPASAAATPLAPGESAPRQNAPAPEKRQVTTGSDPFDFIRGLAKAAYEGDGRAQYLVGRELDRCEMTLSLVRRSDGDPEDIIWGFPDSWPQELKERSIAEYRRCRRLMKEDPFAELPARKGGYPFQYWKQRATESGYPLAVTERALSESSRPSVEAVDVLTKAAMSGDPDVALTIGFRQSTFDDPVRKTAASAWMLAACRMGADCGANSKVYPFFMCYDPQYPNCDKDRDVELAVSQTLSPENYADAYAQSQVIEEALRNRDPAAIKALLEKFVL
jgi:hypothetical protein